jgi:hypothetical protein
MLAWSSVLISADHTFPRAHTASRPPHYHPGHLSGGCYPTLPYLAVTNRYGGSASLRLGS